MNFLYYYSSQESEINNVEKAAKQIFGAIKGVKVNNNEFFLYEEKYNELCLFQNENIIGHIQGYIRNYGLPIEADLAQHNKIFFEEIIKCWPLHNQYTGSFGTIVRVLKTNQLVIANDPIGFYPVYYFQSEDMILISSSLLLLNLFAKQETDEIGLIQRISPPEFCNYGRRTLFKNIKRILPGEYIKFDLDEKKIIERKFDLSLFQNITTDNLDNAADKLWKVIEKDIEFALKYDKETYIAQSGGMDSRLLLGGIHNKNIHCFTYGDEDMYETKIAKKCAVEKNASFTNFSINKYIFPSKKILKKYILETESVGINPWMAILEKQQGQKGTNCILLGDMCEALPGRNIKKYSTRKARVNLFINSFLFKKKIEFTKGTDILFNQWKIKKSKPILHKFSLIDISKFSITSGYVNQECQKDLDEIFELIKSHNIEYSELYDELFAWYTHARIPMSKQILILKSHFFPISPIMSINILRKTSSIHPSLRFNYVLMDRIFKRAESLSGLRNIPTAQIPFLPIESNSLLRLFVWGLRSKLDQFLIKRVVKNKNLKNRYRLLNSINWPKLYNEEGALEAVSSWFTNDHVNGKKYINLATERKEFRSWPLTTFDIVSVAATNLELELNKELQNKVSLSKE